MYMYMYVWYYNYYNKLLIYMYLQLNYNRGSKGGERGISPPRFQTRLTLYFNMQ